MSDEIVQSLDQGLLTITLNAPDRRNALSQEMALLLLAAVQRANDDPEVRAVLLNGAGGTFCVGGDVRGMAGARTRPSFEAKNAMMRRIVEVSRLLHEMAKPVVAAVERAAAGAGLALALAADLRIVGETAKVTTAFAKIGVSGDYGCLYFLTKLIGSGKAREFALLCPTLSGQEAHALGIMTRVVADAAVAETARALALSLARGPTVALGYIKKNLDNAEDLPFEAYLEAEALHHCRCLQTEDHKEATRAFVEKRPPVFNGR